MAIPPPRCHLRDPAGAASRNSLTGGNGTVEVMFGNKHMLKRATAAVEQSLEPGEQIDVIVYGRDLHFSPEALFVGAGMAGLADTFLLTLTNQRVIVHKGDTMNLSRSRFLGASPRDEVAVTAADPPRSPTHITLSFAGDAGHRFEVPLVWRKEAARFVGALANRDQH